MKVLAQDADAHIRNFWIWVKQAKPGEKLLYHIGNLARDREQGGSKIAQVAPQVYLASSEGLVTLTQQRFENKFMYIAQRTHKRR